MTVYQSINSDQHMILTATAWAVKAGDLSYEFIANMARRSVRQVRNTFQLFGICIQRAAPRSPASLVDGKDFLLENGYLKSKRTETGRKTTEEKASDTKGTSTPITEERTEDEPKMHESDSKDESNAHAHARAYINKLTNNKKTNQTKSNRARDDARTAFAEIKPIPRSEWTEEQVEAYRWIRGNLPKEAFFTEEAFGRAVQVLTIAEIGECWRTAHTRRGAAIGGHFYLDIALAASGSPRPPGTDQRCYVAWPIQWTEENRSHLSKRALAQGEWARMLGEIETDETLLAALGTAEAFEVGEELHVVMEDAHMAEFLVDSYSNLLGRPVRFVETGRLACGM